MLIFGNRNLRRNFCTILVEPPNQSEVLSWDSGEVEILVVGEYGVIAFQIIESNNTWRFSDFLIPGIQCKDRDRDIVVYGIKISLF